MPDGEIVREISEITGEPRVPWAKPGTPDSLNHPILAWAELESYRISADRERLRRVYPPLTRYYRAYDKIRDAPSGFFLGSWASMDNSPRIPGMLCSIDTTAEVVLFARNLATIAHLIGRDDDAARYSQEADALSKRINEVLWDPATKFYYDQNRQRGRHNVKTIAAYWTLLAGIADPEKAAGLVAHLQNPAEFKRVHLVPTVPADQAGYHPKGDYWRGGVWTPTTMMVVRGLERCGYKELARTIALNHVDNVLQVFQETGTVWEFYQPDAVAVGAHANGHRAVPNFTGWTANAPITLFIEYKLGLRVDAPASSVTWTIASPKRVGIERLWFGGITASLVCEDPDAAGQRLVRVTADKPFTLTLAHGGRSVTQQIPAGKNVEIRL
jgi:glycogen debranching enzyme